MTTAPLGCRWCGSEERGHARRWTVGAGWHMWIEPTREQIADRLQERLTALGRTVLDDATRKD